MYFCIPLAKFHDIIILEILNTLEIFFTEFSRNYQFMFPKYLLTLTLKVFFLLEKYFY